MSLIFVICIFVVVIPVAAVVCAMAAYGLVLFLSDVLCVLKSAAAFVRRIFMKNTGTGATGYTAVQHREAQAQRRRADPGGTRTPAGAQLLSVFLVSWAGRPWPSLFSVSQVRSDR